MKNIMLATRVGGLMALVSCLTLAQNSPNVLQAGKCDNFFITFSKKDFDVYKYCYLLPPVVQYFLSCFVCKSK